MNKKDKLIFTIDIGTQSLRCALINKKGEIIALEKIKYEKPYFSVKPGYAEQEPNIYFDSLCKISKKLLEEHADKKDDIIGVALDCFRDSVIVCDDNMNPLRPAILWLDQRQAQAKEKISWYSTLLFWIAGKYQTLVLNRARTPAHWIKENEPEIWKKVTRYMSVATYVTYQLTNQYKDSISNYTGHFPTQFRKRRFYKSDKHFQGQIFGVKLKMLCEIVPVGGIIGTITKKASELTGLPEGLKMFSIGSDKSCETLGLGVINNDVGAVSCGTASTITITNKKYVSPEPFLPAYPSVINNYYNTEIQVYRAYWMLGWFATEFAQKEKKQSKETNIPIEDILNSHLNDVPPGCNGLILQPYWGPGLGRPLSRGAVIGFSDTHTKAHLYRAIIEGIDYELKRGLEGIEKRQHRKIKKIMISGGASQSDEICQIAADIFNLPTYRVQTYETSSLGAAIAAFIAAGEFNNVYDAIKAMVHEGKVFYPNKKNAEHYDYLYKHAYKKMYPRLKDIYRDIKLYEEKDN